MAMVLLALLTSIAVSAVRGTNTSIRIAGNMQAQEESETAAQIAIEGVLSSLNSFTASTGSGYLSDVAVDINRDGTNDYTVKVSAPVCENWTISAGYSATLAATAPKMTYWDVATEVTDTRTGAKTTIHQGVRISLLPSQAPAC